MPRVADITRLATEPPRAAAELASFAATLPFLRRAPRGDGHPVLVLPGFAADDRSTVPLRWFLRDRGYHVHGWRLGRNRGLNRDLLGGAGDRLADLAVRHGRKVSIVGWSLGGIYARELARRTPGSVRQVITLGSPIGMIGRAQTPVPVPCTAIYSKSDGIAPWRTCVQSEGEQCENIEVASSHVGLGHHPRVLRIIADRLAQPEGTWAAYAG